MDSFIKQGKELYESGKITNEDIKDVGAILSKDGDLASKAKRSTVNTKTTTRMTVKQESEKKD